MSNYLRPIVSSMVFFGGINSASRKTLSQVCIGAIIPLYNSLVFHISHLDVVISFPGNFACYLELSNVAQSQPGGGQILRGCKESAREGVSQVSWSGEPCSLTDWQPGHFFIYTEFSKQG